MPFPCQPCPSDCQHPVATEPCSDFVSQGFGPDGDFEHSTFCRSCGHEFADHARTLDADECSDLGFSAGCVGDGAECQFGHNAAYRPHTTDCIPQNGETR